MITNTSTILFLIFYICVNLTIATETSGFFTSNATSNVPRIGRSGKTDFENFFLKASKSVPRIGRQTENENFVSIVLMSFSTLSIYEVGITFFGIQIKMTRILFLVLII